MWDLLNLCFNTYPYSTWDSIPLYLCDLNSSTERKSAIFASHVDADTAKHSPRPPLYLSNPRNLTLSPSSCRNSSNNGEFSLLSKICSSENWPCSKKSENNLKINWIELYHNIIVESDKIYFFDIDNANFKFWFNKDLIQFQKLFWCVRQLTESQWRVQVHFLAQRSHDFFPVIPANANVKIYVNFY